MRGVSKKGVGVGRKGMACNQLQSRTFYRTPFAHERGAIVQFHWLLPLERRKRDPGNEVGVKLVRAQRKMTHEKNRGEAQREKALLAPGLSASFFALSRN